MTKDPLSLAQEKLELYLQQSPGLRSTLGLAIKNVDGYTKAQGTKSQEVNNESDRPSLHLIPNTMPSNVNLASNLCSLDYTLRVVIYTGDQQVNLKLLPVLWALYAAMVAAIDDSALLGLEWEGQPYIKNFTLSNSQPLISDPQKNAGIVGWLSITDLVLHMTFARSLVKQFHYQSP